jgi:hypothetical protein
MTETRSLRPAAAEAIAGVRPLRPADVPALASMRNRCFPFESPAPRAALERDLRDVFLDNPWRDPDLPSLVYEDAGGRVIGFLGVVPRPMSLGGVRIRAATTTRLMVEPDRRGVAALALLRSFLRGPQDLSLADQASDDSRALWERLGGTTAVLYSVDWFRPIAPARAALSYLGYMTRSHTLEVIARSLGRMIDAAFASVPRNPFRPRPSPLAGDELSECDLLHRLSESTDAYTLGPRYTPSTLAWLFSMHERRLHGLRKVLVRDGATPIGWYVYGLNRRSFAQVVRLGTTRGRLGDVLEHLVDDARRHGAVGLLGRLEPRLLGEMRDPLCIFRRAPWVLVHSRSSAVLDAIARGDAILSRMEGEWWIPR